MAAFVLDASVTLAWFFTDEPDPDVLLDLFPEHSAAAPMVWRYEIANAFRMAERRRRIEAELTDEFLDILDALPVRPESAMAAAGDLLALARKHDLTVYDAAYLELSIRLNLPLATLDKRLIKAAESDSIEVLK